MKYIEIKNLDKYNPGYRDRNMIWCKIYFSMLNADPEMEMIDEINKWRYISFVIIQLQTKKPIPIDEQYLIRKGFDLKKCPICNTLKVLHNFITINEESPQERSLEKSRVEESRVEKSRVDIADDVNVLFKKWNDVALEGDKLQPINAITETRRSKIRLRLKQETFKDFDLILSAIKEQPFLLGDNERSWCVSFDWLIENDTNHVKVLEKRYLSVKNTNRFTDIQKKNIESGRRLLERDE